MKIIYHKNKKKQVRDDALAQFRQTHQKLEGEHAELLGGLRTKILESGPFPVCESSTVPIDRKKNMNTVLRFLELKPGFADGNFQGLLSGKYH